MWAGNTSPRHQGAVSSTPVTQLLPPAPAPACSASLHVLPPSPTCLYELIPCPTCLHVLPPCPICLHVPGGVVTLCWLLPTSKLPHPPNAGCHRLSLSHIMHRPWYFSADRPGNGLSNYRDLGIEGRRGVIREFVMARRRQGSGGRWWPSLES